MSQPVKLSDQLVIDARVTSGLAKRSIAGQIEFWASIGRAVEVLLHRPAIEALHAESIRSVGEALSLAGTLEGDRRVAALLSTLPYPHYAPADDHPGMLVRTEEGGERTLGRFVQRQFVPAEPDHGTKGS